MAVVGTPTIEDTYCTVDQDYHFTYTTIYHVTTDDNNDGPITASSPAIIPRYGDSYSVGNDSDPEAFAIGAVVKRQHLENSLRHWSVTITHSTKQQNTRLTNIKYGFPTNEPVKVSGSFQRGTKIVDRERDGKILANSAEERRLTEVPYGHDTLIIEKNTETISLLQRAKSMFKTNESTVWGLPAHAVLLTQWTYDILYYGRTAYVKNRLEFEISYDLDHEGNFIGWDLDMLDEGYRILVDSTKEDPRERYVVPMPNDAPLAKPILLDGQGSWLDTNTDPDGIWIPKGVIHEYDYSLLTFIPNPLPGPFV